MGSFSAEPTGHRDAVFGLARQGGCVLLVRNPRVSRGARRSWWDLPGGAAWGGETLPEALKREWREETGLSVEVGDLFLVTDGSKRRPEGQVLYTWRAFFFDVRSAGEPRPGEGIDEVAWVPEAEVPERLDAPYHAPLRDWFAGSSARYAPLAWIEPADPVASADGRVPRSLLALAALAAVGRRSELEIEIRRALEQGESHARIEEALLQVVPYAGYPRAISAFSVARPLLGEPPGGAPEPETPLASGPEVFAEVYGETADNVHAGLEALHPVLAAWTLSHAYGQVLARPVALSLLERELLAVSILAAMGQLEDPLLGHMRAALRLGAAAAQVAAAVQVVPHVVGEARLDAARRLLERL